MPTIVPFIEYRIRIAIALDRLIARRLPALAEQRGLRRVTKTEVFEEALALWLAQYQDEGQPVVTTVTPSLTSPPASEGEPT